MLREEEINKAYDKWQDDLECSERTVWECACRWADEHPKNPWISVEERLPEEGQAVIVRLAFGAGNHAACNYSNGQFVLALCIETSNVDIQSRLKLPAITHWMPIPERKR